jgi:hypothetical protein
MDQQKQGNRYAGSGLWVWFVPLSFLVHVIEEAFGGDGLMAWMAAGGGVDWSLARFLGYNMGGLAVLSLAAWAARRWDMWRWPLVSGAAIYIANGVWHAAICFMTRSYVPGVITGLTLYIPLGCFIICRLRHLMSARAITIAIIIGMVIHAGVIWFVLRMPGFQMG